MARPHQPGRLLTCLLSAAASACAPTVQLAEPPRLQSTTWQGAKAAAESWPLPNVGLAAAFGSPALDALIARAHAANSEIGIARARIAAARAQLQIARAAMLPVVNSSAGLSANRSDNVGGSVFDFSDAFAGLDVSWDLDLFGARRAGRRAAVHRIAAAEFDREATALAVEAEVTRSFIQLAALRARVEFLDRNIEHARELERIIQVRLREGEATKVDTGLQAIEVRQLEVERTRLLEAQARTSNALAVLIGEEAPRFAAPPPPLTSLAPPSFGAGQPGDLLVRRPDIRAAEARIRAASGDVMAARAAFLPNLTLTASALGQAATLTGPFGATLSAGASLLAPIFGRGRLRGELGSASAAQVESVELYRGTLLTALREAEDALAGAEQSRRREAMLDQVVEDARTTARLRRLQFIEGEADLRDALDAQRLLVQAEDARAVAVQERMEAAIDLYRALGGTPRG